MHTRAASHIHTLYSSTYSQARSSVNPNLFFTMCSQTEYLQWCSLMSCMLYSHEAWSEMLTSNVEKLLSPWSSSSCRFSSSSKDKYARLSVLMCKRQVATDLDIRCQGKRTNKVNLLVPVPFSLAPGWLRITPHSKGTGFGQRLTGASFTFGAVAIIFRHQLCSRYCTGSWYSKFNSKMGLQHGSQPLTPGRPKPHPLQNNKPCPLYNFSRKTQLSQLAQPAIDIMTLLRFRMGAYLLLYLMLLCATMINIQGISLQSQKQVLASQIQQYEVGMQAIP